MTGDHIRRIAANRRARRNYEVLEQLEAGIALLGTEVKSCRAGGVDISDAYAELSDGEAWLVNAHIAPYEHGNVYNHDPRRPRRLLLKRREIDKWAVKVNERGLTVVALEAYFKGHKVKLTLALVRGRSTMDKRDRIKEEDDRREMARAMKSATRRG